MNSSTKTGIIGIAAGVLIAAIGILFYIKGTSGNSSSGSESIGVGDARGTQVAIAQEVVRPAPPPEAINRLRSRKINAIFQMKGKAADADWGIRGSAYFLYEVSIQALSEIKSKEKLGNGGFKVEEVRTFLKVHDSVTVSDTDFSLALDTLPISTIQSACAVGGLFPPLLPYAVAAEEGLEGVRQLDGMGIKDALKKINLELPAELQQHIDQYASKQLQKWMGNTRSINGKSYLFTYYTDKSGSPMHMTFRYSDGADVTDEDELMLLQRANAFINSELLPDVNSKPGASWEVKAEEVQELFDPYVDGNYAGSIRVTRKEDAPNGEWTLELSPGVIRVLSPTGSTTGSLNLKEGTAQIELEAYSVNNLFASGTANVSKLSKHHLLFNARFDGACQFEGRIVSDLLPAD